MPHTTYYTRPSSPSSGRTSWPAPIGRSRRRENMVGVNMALAEFVKFKHGLYKSCGIECVEGIMLEPCLLQPCYTMKP